MIVRRAPRWVFALRFRRHRLAVVATWIVIALYAIAATTEFVAPYASSTYAAERPFHPPQALRVRLPAAAGGGFALHVRDLRSELDPRDFRRRYEVESDDVTRVHVLGRGEPYRLWGLVPMDRHLLAPAAGGALHLWGTDRLGRDVFSRTVHGARVSLSIGLLGVATAFLIGTVLGAVSGLVGGAADTLVQRSIEFLESLPTIPLWMALAAAIPIHVPPVQVYFLITLILSLVGWTGLARVVRGRFLSLREEPFVLAARLDGAGVVRLALRHMLPSMTSHIIAALTLAIPGMILAETSLSFLGIGLRPPSVSWGVLLQEARNVRSLLEAPWLLLPGAAVMITVLALNYLGDGLRDAADPHA